MLTLGLFVSFFLLFYSLIIGEFPEIETLKELWMRFGLPAIGALAMFLLGTFLTKTSLAGIFWGILGWLLPVWIIDGLNDSRHFKYQQMVKNMIVTSAGMYSAGQLTSEVIRTVALRMPEPFSGELQEMVGRRKLDPHASVPKMLIALSSKYGLPELRAMAAVIATSERAGGPVAAARGLKRLGRALRMRDRLAYERQKANMEPRIAAIVVIGLLGIGLLLDLFLWHDLFMDGAGKILLALSSALIVGMTVMAFKVTRSKDLM